MLRLPREPERVTRRRAANALRALAMDAVELAKSGHPGMPMGMADVAEVLWKNFLHHDPADPHWLNRDRFVMSNGHGSMLLYALLHLSGYDLPMDELRRFRQLHSRTPGHPEVGLTPGVETTTGPLGQGLANAVGMALAERLLAAEFNRPGYSIVDHWTYAFVGDGCLMEGVSQEAISLAGTLGLDRLIVFYDDNCISIDGDVDGWFRDDTPARFEACGWKVIRAVNGHDGDCIFRAINSARLCRGKPVLICCKTVIGFGAPNKQGRAEAHGAPLGKEEIALARAQLGWYEPPFSIPHDVAMYWNAQERGQELRYAWDPLFHAYRRAHPALADALEQRMRGLLPAALDVTWIETLRQQRENLQPTATRKSSERVLNEVAPELPALFGGSADLSESNLTLWKDAPRVSPGHLAGRYLSYGVREFGMAAVMNGMALHGGFIPFGGTFAVFSDYSRNAIRMAALMQLRVIHVLTHDSIGLGEDGPTHQPVEQASTLRLIPNLDVWRPCDGLETTVAWRSAIERSKGPSALLLSRQALKPMARTDVQEAQIIRGGYVLAEPLLPLSVILIATGSEVALAMQAQALLADFNIGARVVSMPCTQRFDGQDSAWHEAVLPRGLPRVAVEAAHPDFWRKYVGLEGEVIGIARFGESAPAGLLFEYFGITPAAVADAARRLVTDQASSRQTSGSHPSNRGARAVPLLHHRNLVESSPQFDSVVFDLDGTLIDTAPDIAAALNLALKELGLAVADAEQVQSWIGFGTYNLLTEALRATQGEGGSIPIDAAMDVFKRHYRSVNGRLGPFYPGARETLEQLRGLGVPIALMTNKEAQFARPLLAAHGLQRMFDVVVFGDTLAQKKPHAEPLEHCMSRLRSTPPRTLVVGDSEIDVATARNAQVPVWVVSYGYRHARDAQDLAADRVIDTLADILPQMNTRRRISSSTAAAAAN